MIVMLEIEQYTIGGFYSLLNKQQKEQGEALVITVLFDNEYEIYNSLNG